jgi:hypothetical protein
LPDPAPSPPHSAAVSGRRQSPAAARNREPILQVLLETLPERGTLIEIASGTGEHAAYFAGRFPHIVWQPTDPDPEALASIAAWRAEAGPANLLEPLRLDASAEMWPVTSADAILCVNMVHISPWAATEGLMRGAGRLLAEGAPLLLYGPYRRAGVLTAPSNVAFDESLRARNPEWGLRELEAVEAEAVRHGLRLERVVEMPANNLTVLFRA